MNERIRLLAKQSGLEIPAETEYNGHIYRDTLEKFAQLLVEAVLDQVKERAYYTGDRDWSDELDRQWIQLEFGYGSLHDAKIFGVE